VNPDQDAVRDGLRRWRETLATDRPRPTDEDLDAIARAFPADPPIDALSQDGVLRLAEASHVAKQASLGVPKPWMGMPKEIRWTPAKAAGSASPGVSLAKPAKTAPIKSAVVRSDPDRRARLVDALIEWRDSAGFGSKDLERNRIMNIIDSGYVTSAEIASLLPPALQNKADAIVAVIQAHQDSATLPATGSNDPVSSSGEADSDLLSLTFAQLGDVESVPRGSGRGSVHKQARPGDGVTLSWTPSVTGGETIYRIIASDEEMPFSPDELGVEEVARTRAQQFIHKRAFSSAVRYYQVWANSGRTLEEATAAQPTLIGEVAVVAPLTSLNVQQDGDEVVLTWNQPLPGADRIHISRAHRQEGRVVGRGEELPAVSGGLTICHDSTTQPGEAYVYSARVAAEICVGQNNWTELSDAIECDFVVDTPLQQVLLQIEAPGGAGSPTVDLVWDPPRVGQVVIYRKDRLPTQDITKIHEKKRLEAAGLVDKDIPPNQGVNTGNGRMVMRGVRLREGRTYFIAVNVQGDSVAVSEPVSAAYVQPVLHPRLIDRGVRQILTFEWPPGVERVTIFVAPAERGDQEFNDEHAHLTVTGVEYYNKGGVELDLREWGPGVSVYAVTKVAHGGVDQRGAPVEVPFSPKRRLDYAVRRDSTGLLVTVHTDQPHVALPSFWLIYQQGRMPLHIGDGAALRGWVAGAGDPTHASSELKPVGLGDEHSWRFNTPSPGGYIRLFVKRDKLGEFALYDPAYDQLRF